MICEMCIRDSFCYVLALILRYLWVKTGYGDYMMIFYYLHYFLLGMLVWEIHQAGRRIGAQLLVYIGMIAAAGAGLALGREMCIRDRSGERACALRRQHLALHLHSAV